MQRKLTLRLEDLTVDSFRTSPGESAKGTVFGEQYCTCYTQCTCPGCPTCANTCPNTCANTCDDPSCVGCGETGYSCDETGCDCSINATRCGGYICP